MCRSHCLFISCFSIEEKNDYICIWTLLCVQCKSINNFYTCHKQWQNSNVGKKILCEIHTTFTYPAFIIEEKNVRSPTFIFELFLCGLQFSEISASALITSNVSINYHILTLQSSNFYQLRNHTIFQMKL